MGNKLTANCPCVCNGCTIGSDQPGPIAAKGVGDLGLASGLRGTYNKKLGGTEKYYRFSVIVLDIWDLDI